MPGAWCWFSHKCPVPSDCTTISTTHASLPTAWSKTGSAWTRSSSTASARSWKGRSLGSLGAKIPYQLARHSPNILVNGNSILVTWDEQARAWFECPACGRRCKHLYLDALACRICCRLDYASRHLHRQVPGV